MASRSNPLHSAHWALIAIRGEHFPDIEAVSSLRKDSGAVAMRLARCRLIFSSREAFLGYSIIIVSLYFGFGSCFWFSLFFTAATANCQSLKRVLAVLAASGLPELIWQFWQFWQSHVVERIGFHFPSILESRILSESASSFLSR